MSERAGLMARLLGGGGGKALIQPEQWTDYSSGSYGTALWSYDSRFVTYANLYRSQPAVRQVVQFIAENMAQVPIKEFERVSAVERQPVTDSPLARALQAPNPWVSQFEFIRDMVTDLEIFDVAYAQIGKSGGELIFTRIPPDAVTPLGVEPGSGPKAYSVQKRDGTTVELARDSVLSVTGYDGGISPLETLRRVIAEDMAAGQYREGMYRNGMRNAGVIERPIDAPEWSDTGRERFLSQIHARHTGSNSSGRPLLLEEGMTWKSDQINSRSEEYIAGREFTVRAVANAYRISPAVLGLSDAPYASITAYNQQLYQNALAPRLVHLTQALERQLIPARERPKFYLEFNLEAKLRGSFQEQAMVASQAVGGPFMTIDEYRAVVDLPPLTDDQKDELLGLAGAPNPGGDGPAGVNTEPPAPSDDTPDTTLDEPKSTGQKRVDRGAVRRRNKWAEKFEAVLASNIERAAKSRAAFVKARWQNELEADMRPLIEQQVVSEGARKAAQLRGDFDPKLVQHYLDAVAENTAKQMSVTLEHAKKRHGDDQQAVKVAVLGVAAKTAVSLATSMLSFARENAGQQNGAGTKTWSTTSADSRHGDVDGETVKIGTEFSNGMAYPGDPSGDPEDTINCSCVLDIN